ncbi:VCBS repeat-containing protein, partial [bacterium]|nr:VCBS repeat-containing protein [bacterium]
MKHKRQLLLAGLIAVLVSISCIAQAQVGVPEIFPFSKENTVLIKTAGGFNFDNDEYLDIIGIASLVDKKGQVIPRSSYLVHLEESIAKDFIVQWKYSIPEKLMADFVDIAVTDMDGDALPEIVAVLNISDVGGSDQPAWLYSFEYIDGFPDAPTATIGRTSALITRPRPMFIYTGDWNGDNNPDIVVSSGGPGRSIIIVSANGQVSSKNFDIIYQAHNLSTLQGILSFRALTANLNTAPGEELVVFGGEGDLQVEVFGHETRAAILTHTVRGVKR